MNISKWEMWLANLEPAHKKRDGNPISFFKEN